MLTEIVNEHQVLWFDLMKVSSVGPSYMSTIPGGLLRGAFDVVVDGKTFQLFVQVEKIKEERDKFIASVNKVHWCGRL